MNTATIKISVLTLLLLTAGSAFTQPVPMFHPDGTTHYYEAVVSPSGISWQQANDAAMAAGGYLATITSQVENDFIYGIIDDDMYWYERPNGILEGPWTGGFQVKGSSEPEEGWQWINGEDFSFINWSPSGPNNLNDNENRIHFGGTQSVRTPTWDDISEDVTNLQGYVIEYSAPSQTVGLFQYDMQQSFLGYTLFAPQNGNMTYLIDNQGREIHSWTSDTDQGNAVYLLEDGNLLRTVEVEDPYFSAGGFNGRLEEFDWDGNLVWEFDYSSELYLSHHDALRLPNGNTLIVVWEVKTEEEAIEAGRNPDSLTSGELWPDMLIEVEPTYPSGGNIVWEWHLWDHLIQDFDPTKQNYGVVEDHPELYDINFLGPYNPGQADWNHVNGIAYHEEFDQIIISAHHVNELWVIDHSTTTEEAAGHTGGLYGKGGDLLYRWGNPQAYRAGTADDQQFFGQHNTHWIGPRLQGEGNILLFNNGNGRPGGVQFSEVMEIVPPVDGNGFYADPLPGEPYGPAEPIWVYTADPVTDFYGHIVSGAQRLPNGNTLICNGPNGHFFEVTPNLETVWSYINPVIASGTMVQGEPLPGSALVKQNITFRSPRYAPEYRGFTGRDLMPGSFLELYPSITPVMVELTPLASPVIIPSQGGDLTFDLYLENIGTLPQNFDAWIDITYEGETPTTVVRREFNNFLSGLSISRQDMSYPIPASYAAGNYTFTLRVGTYPDDVWNESSFSFEKEGTLIAGINFVPFPVNGAQDPFEEAVLAETSMPAEYAVIGNYPNPFNPVTTLQFTLGSADFVTLSVYDVQGRLVETLVTGYRPAGSHQVQFDASNLASGVYLYQLEGGSFTISNKMVLVK